MIFMKFTICGTRAQLWNRGLLAACGIAASTFAADLHAVGTWIALQNQAPGTVETMLLLPDGTVMAEGGGTTRTWYRLTPGGSGGYTNGVWSTRSQMNFSRQYFASQVLPSGRVFVAGAEYGNGTTNAEIYNIAADSWSIVPVPAGIINTANTTNSAGANQAGFSDSGSVLLDNGKILIEPVYPASSSNTCIYDSVSNTWTTEHLVRGTDEDEASWVKLPDGSILTVDYGTITSERYIPSLNQWISDANLPVNLYDPYGEEMGPGLLLPNGKVFFIGSTPYTAIYSPSGTTNSGTWIQGPNTPGFLGAPDAPAAMMNNGKIICCLSPTPYTTSNVFTTPTYFYEYDYAVSNTGGFTAVSAPGGGASLNQATYYSRFLDLPDGTVLYSSGGSQLYVYVPDGSPVASGKPAVSGILSNPDGSIHLTGTLFNGISQGAAYGDDVQPDSNYPLVRFTDGGGNVTTGSSFNWSTARVQTGGQAVTTECSLSQAVFVNGPLSYSVQVSANGISSDPVSFSGPVWVDFNSTNLLQVGSYSYPFKTMAQGISAVAAYGGIFLKPGLSHETMTISTPMTITAVGGTAIVGQ